MLKTKNLKVCFLAGTLGRGGSERQLIYMLRALTIAGVSTRVLCLTKGEALQSEIEAMGIRVEWVGRSGWKARRLYEIIKLLRREPADILQSAHFYTNLYVAAAARVLNVKAVGAIRSDLLTEIAANGLAGQWDLKLPHHLITNSSLAWERAKARGIPSQRIDLVPNVVNPDWLTNGVGTNGHQSISILFSGRLSDAKRPDRFLRMVSKLAGSDKRIKAVIAGDGPLKSGVQALANTLKIEMNQLEFLGEQSDMRSVYENVDMLVLTSDYEGTPNVVLEAMAFGLPVIATRVGGVPEIVGTDRGLMVDPEDEDGLAASTLRLVNDAALRKKFGKLGREYVTSFHSIDALQGRLMGIYRKLLPQ
jgi:glycosyltransferase involved in cell wall biosynthesis